MVKNFVSQTQQVWDYIFCEGLLPAPVRKNVLKTDTFFILVLCSTKTNICRASHCRVTAEEKKNVKKVQYEKRWVKVGNFLDKSIARKVYVDCWTCCEDGLIKWQNRAHCHIKPKKLTFLAWIKDDVTVIFLLSVSFMLSEAGISKNYCATDSGSPEVELRFCPWLILFKYWTGWPVLNFWSMLYVNFISMHRGARPKVRWQDLKLNTRAQND